MNTARRITVNFLSLTSAEIISKSLQLIIFVYLARALGKDDFGIFSFGISFALLIVIIANFGLNTLLVREISRKKKLASKYVSNAFVSKIMLSTLTLLSTYIFLNLMGYSDKAKLVAYIMVSFAIIQSFTDLFYSVFRAFERMHYDAFIKVLRMLILILLVYFAIKNNLGLIISSLIFPLTEILMLLLAASISYTKFIKLSLEFDYIFSRNLLKKSSLFCLSLTFASIFTYIDLVMLSKIKSTTEVGIYAVSANIIIALIFIPVMYGNAIFPVISRFYISSKKSLKFAYERSFKYMLIIGLPLSAGIYLLSSKIILLLYGNEYIASVIVLNILAGYLFLRFLNVVSGFTLSSINKQGSRVFSQGIAALINIILNIILIPAYGFVGAAVATLITEIIFFFTYIFFIIRYNLRIKFVRLFIKPLIATVIMVYLLSFIENIFLEVVLGIVIYFLTLFFLRTIDKQDKLIFNKVVKNL